MDRLFTTSVRDGIRGTKVVMISPSFSRSVFRFGDASIIAMVVVSNCVVVNGIKWFIFGVRIPRVCSWIRGGMSLVVVLSASSEASSLLSAEVSLSKLISRKDDAVDFDWS